MTKTAHRAMVAILLITAALSLSCLGKGGAFVVIVDIYIDKASIQTIGKHMSKLKANYEGPDEEFHIEVHPKKHAERNLDLTKKFVGMIFDTLNAQLQKDDVQFVANFTTLESTESQGLQEKYCIENKNIVDISYMFFNERPNPDSLYRNHLFIINCHGNRAVFPRLSNVATQNKCGNIIGVLLSSPMTLRTLILDSIYSLLFVQPVKTPDQSVNLSIGACEFINRCSIVSKEGDFGFFFPNATSVGPPAELQKFSYLKDYMMLNGGEPKTAPIKRTHISRLRAY